MNKKTFKKAGYIHIKTLGHGYHVLEYIKGAKPFQFEIWFSNKNHASYGLIYKNTHLEFARGGTI